MEAVQRRNYPVVQALVMFASLIYVAVNIIVDALYTYIDPRCAASGLTWAVIGAPSGAVPIGAPARLPLQRRRRPLLEHFAVASNRDLTVEQALEGGDPAAARSEWGLAWRRFRRNRAAIAGGIVLIAIAIVAILADVIAPFSLNYYNPELFNSPPGEGGHLLGTDRRGTRRVHPRGSRATHLAAHRLLGGRHSCGRRHARGFGGWIFGGKVDWAISRVLDVLLAFPGILLAIVIVSTLGPGINNALIALGSRPFPSMRGSCGAPRCRRVSWCMCGRREPWACARPGSCCATCCPTS